MSGIRIAKRILAGRVVKDEMSFIGEPKDVTSDCLRAVIEFIGAGNTKFITIDGVPKYEITVRELMEGVPE